MIAIFAAASLFAAIIPSMMTALAFHNDHGQSDKASAGDCKRFTDKADFCQDRASKDVLQDQ